MVDDTDIFVMTDKGRAELSAEVSKLPAKLRRCLDMVDGARTAGDFAPNFRPGESGAVLEELRAGGYIARKA
ncbi:hypothetical protein [Usitatibacter palustris]|uniref:Uncharacterized protein n=1 Tax=Usitatibacter palustris TaxID=2732487 RepID=A0A6M4HE32_9PROT|nr:hypothetical protein [Usitatibacter palustris]QJR16237.1 hypothetical protein DSM104440_03066 [Usitatibacter palustris]